MKFIKPKRKVNKIFLHCSAYPHQDLIGNDLVDEIENWHLEREFNGIGYHYIIDHLGSLLEGRSLERNPAAQIGHNSRSIAICLDGLFFNQFNKSQFKTLETLALEFDKAYKQVITYHGHCEVANKECPVFDYPAVLGLDRSGRRVSSQRTSFEKYEPSLFETNIGRRILEITSRGEDVKLLQEQLGVKVDGIFGRETYMAVVEFQRVNNLVGDGIVGPITCETLQNDTLENLIK